MKTQEFTTSIQVNGETMLFKYGKLAPRAESAVITQLGETVILTVVSMSQSNSTLDYFPLTVEYIEKFYAGGIISGSRFLKREMRPSDSAVLKARQIDHSIRSLFPKNFKRDVNVIVTVLSYDGIHDPEVLAVNSASMALMLSSLPFMGPSASVRIGVKKDELLVNPGNDIEEELDGVFMVSVREDRVLNIEGWGDQIEEEVMDKILDKAVEVTKPILLAQSEFAKEHGKEKLTVNDEDDTKELIEKIKNGYSSEIENALYDKDNRSSILLALKEKIKEGNEELEDNAISDSIDYIAKSIMRENVLNNDKRTSGRELNEIRELEVELNILPRVHGSALFRRGKTQCLSVTTLGSTRLVQTLESFEGEEEKPFMHHYNGPSYSLGEAGRFSYYPGRREIGHGHIAENALKKVLPTTEDFPYTIRVVSEILSQQGSSSMAATCGTSLSLMAAGVPIKAQIAGISVGLVTQDNNLEEYKLLTDIEDVEDFYGDMDFKVTGSSKGVTAIQLDNKLMGVPVKILKEAFRKSKEARLKILEVMNAEINTPNSELSKYAPRVKKLNINPEKIGELIGPGGKNIKGIIEKCENLVDIDIKDDGQVLITSASQEMSKLAEEMVLATVEEAEIGKIYTGKVDKIMPYGAFVDVSSAITGLLHVSEMSNEFVKDPSTIVKEGQTVKVKVVKIENGKVSFSMKGIDQA